MKNEDEKTIQQTSNEAERLLNALDNLEISKPQFKESHPDLARSIPDTKTEFRPNQEEKSGDNLPLWIAIGSLIAGITMSALVFSGMQPSTVNSSNQNPNPAPNSNSENQSTEASTDQRKQEGTEAGQNAKTSNTEASNPEPRTAIEKQKKEDFRPVEATPRGAWGTAAEYKFGQLPGEEYPDSCAFSRTDSAGKTTIDKSSVEFWACRDNGGNSSDGFSIAWADGKTTRYTFGPDGVGTVVGTNGFSYPMAWRNDTYNSSNIIIISHQDGATTWIPGRVN